MEAPARRRYHSPLREQRARQTREAVLAAAIRLFTTRGWAATGMRDIAREAGIATETLYSHFPSKVTLLHTVLDIAVVGDEAAVPLADRPAFSALGRGSRAERAAAAAQLMAGIQVRIAPLGKVLREAAYGDDTIAGMLAATFERQRLDVAAGVGLILGREPTDREADTVWALVSLEVYLLLTEARGLSTDEYESWLAETLASLLPHE